MMGKKRIKNVEHKGVRINIIWLLIVSTIISLGVICMCIIYAWTHDAIDPERVLIVGVQSQSSNNTQNTVPPIKHKIDLKVLINKSMQQEPEIIPIVKPTIAVSVPDCILLRQENGTKKTEATLYCD